MAPEVRLVVTGDELLRGFVQDLNTSYLAADMRHAGLALRGVELSSDAFDDVVDALGRAAASATLVVVTGGLGPTHDDRTSEAVASVAGRPLQLRDEVLDVVEGRVRAMSRGRKIDPAVFAAGNRKQATLPQGALALEPRGTAPGYVLEDDQQRVWVVLPGPPGELRYAWQQAKATTSVQQVIASSEHEHERLVRAWGIPESLAVAELEKAGHEDSPACRVTLCAREGELELEVRGPDIARVNEVTETVRNGLGDRVFAVDDERTVAELVGKLLVDRGSTIGLAESCTGGMLGSFLTTTAGTSAYFQGGVVCYDNAIKRDILGVDARDLEQHGAVSEQVARQMAHGAQRVLGADVGVGITGIAGPAGGSDEKPVGTVFVSVAIDGECDVRHLRLPGDRDSVRRRSSFAALHMVRELLTRS